METMTDSLPLSGGPSPAPSGSAIVCNACGYSGDICTFLPSMGIDSDCRCPKCRSTDNAHNDKYREQISKAWNCPHTGTLVDGGRAADGRALFKCTECGSIGLEWSMRKLPRPSPNTDSAAAG